MQNYCSACHHRTRSTDKTVVDGEDIYHTNCFYGKEDKDEEVNSDTRNEHGYPLTSPNKT